MARNGARTSCLPAREARSDFAEVFRGWFALRAQADRMSALRKDVFVGSRFNCYTARSFTTQSLLGAIFEHSRR